MIDISKNSIVLGNSPLSKSQYQPDEIKSKINQAMNDSKNSNIKSDDAKNINPSPNLITNKSNVSFSDKLPTNINPPLNATKSNLINSQNLKESTTNLNPQNEFQTPQKTNINQQPQLEVENDKNKSQKAISQQSKAQKNKNTK